MIQEKRPIRQMAFDEALAMVRREYPGMELPESAATWFDTLVNSECPIYEDEFLRAILHICQEKTWHSHNNLALLVMDSVAEEHQKQRRPDTVAIPASALIEALPQPKDSSMAAIQRELINRYPDFAKKMPREDGERAIGHNHRINREIINGLKNENYKIPPAYTEYFKEE